MKIRDIRDNKKRDRTNRIEEIVGIGKLDYKSFRKLVKEIVAKTLAKEVDGTIYDR